MGRGEDSPLMTDEEFAIGLADATARGLIEWQGDEDLKLTNKGIDLAMSLRESLGDTNYIIMQLFFERIRECVDEHNIQ